MRRKSERGFTLVELLVVIAVIALLAGLLLPALSKAKQRGRAAQDLSNLKDVGAAVHMYANENENLLMLDALIPGSHSWATVLATNIGVGKSDIFVCPSYKPFHWKNWLNIYGIRKDAPTGCASGPGGVFFRVDCLKIRDPSDYLLVADTTSQAQGGFTARQYYFFETTSPLRIVHARHFGKANGLFLDGHVEPCNQRRLESQGITAEYGKDAAIGYFSDDE